MGREGGERESGREGKRDSYRKRERTKQTKTGGCKETDMQQERQRDGDIKTTERQTKPVQLQVPASHHVMRKVLV